jgi:predicted  nucleic acid-binding Zn-ribbon protein
MNQLRKVNQNLWKIGDRLRVLEKEQRFDNEFIELARSVYKLNDQRAEIKRKINKETNSEYKEIKIY